MRSCNGHVEGKSNLRSLRKGFVEKEVFEQNFKEWRFDRGDGRGNKNLSFSKHGMSGGWLTGSKRPAMI